MFPSPYVQTITYEDTTTVASTQVDRIGYTDGTSGNISDFSIYYDYDSLGNISSVTSSVRPQLDASYLYDVQGQLTYEGNYAGNYMYYYDTYGNIRSVTSVDSTTGTETTLHTYTYGDSSWLDKLTAYDGESITYDEIGNPLSYYNGTRWTFTWQNGRQLASAAKSGTTVSYTYDVAGIRDSKTVTTSGGTITYNYLTQNGQVVRQTWTESGTAHVMDFIYDNNGRPYAFIYDGTLYYYILNQQGDVVIITDATGATVGRYVYDAWGNVIYGYGTMNEINPIRYRGYYYDKETGLYYLQSRYYDPQVKRFVNADGYVSTGQVFIGYNMFAYCNNNSTNHVDNSGNSMNTAYMATDGPGSSEQSGYPSPKAQSISNQIENNVKDDLSQYGLNYSNYSNDYSVKVTQSTTNWTRDDALNYSAPGIGTSILVGEIGGLISCPYLYFVTLSAALYFGIQSAVSSIPPGEYTTYFVVVEYDIDVTEIGETVRWQEEATYMVVGEQLYLMKYDCGIK